MSIVRRPDCARCLRTALLVIALALIAACGDDGGGTAPDEGQPAANLPGALTDVYGEYEISLQIQYTWPGKGRVASFTRPGYVNVAASEPGVINVPPGTELPGIPSSEVMFGAAYVQNPVHVSIGTLGFDQHGDCGIISTLRIGIPIGDAYIFSYDGCDAVADAGANKGAFACVPHFYGTAEASDSVNLVYFMNVATVNDAGTVMLTGYLADDHVEEAAAANQAYVHFVHEWFGPMDDIFILGEGTTFSLTIGSGQIVGQFRGVARSATAMIVEDLLVEATFGGKRSPTAAADARP